MEKVVGHSTSTKFLGLLQSKVGKLLIWLLLIISSNFLNFIHSSCISAEVFLDTQAIDYLILYVFRLELNILQSKVKA